MRKRGVITLTFFSLVIFLLSPAAPSSASETPITLKAGEIQTLTYTPGATVQYVLDPQGGTQWPIDQTVGSKGSGQNFSEADLAALTNVQLGAKIKQGYNDECPVWSDHPNFARYRYELIGTLPAGIELTCDGFILGTATEVGTKTFSIKVIGKESLITVPITFNVVSNNDLQWIPGLNNFLEFGYPLGTPLVDIDVKLKQYLTNIDTSTALSFTCSGGLPTGAMCSNNHGIEGSLAGLGTSTFQITATNGSKSATINLRGNVCNNPLNCTQDQANIDLTSNNDPLPLPLPIPEPGGKKQDNSAPSMVNENQNQQGQSQNNGNNVASGDQQISGNNQVNGMQQSENAAAAQAVAAEAARIATARAIAAEAARVAAEIKAAEVAKAKSDLKNILESDGKPSLDTFRAAGIEGITQKNVEKVNEKILTLPVEQRSNPTAIEKMITVVTFFDPQTPPVISDFANKGIGIVTNRILDKVANELLTVPESQQGDVAAIKQIVQRVATVDKLSTPETSKSIRASDLVAINALSNSNTKKVTITLALKKLDPSSIDTYQKVLAEIAKQEAIIKARADKLAAIKAKLASRSSKP